MPNNKTAPQQRPRQQLGCSDTRLKKRHRMACLVTTAPDQAAELCRSVLLQPIDALLETTPFHRAGKEASVHQAATKRKMMKVMHEYLRARRILSDTDAELLMKEMWVLLCGESFSQCQQPCCTRHADYGSMFCWAHKSNEAQGIHGHVSNTLQEVAGQLVNIACTNANVSWDDSAVAVIAAAVASMNGDAAAVAAAAGEGAAGEEGVAAKAGRRGGKRPRRRAAAQQQQVQMDGSAAAAAAAAAAIAAQEAQEKEAAAGLTGTERAEAEAAAAAAAAAVLGVWGQEQALDDVDRVSCSWGAAVAEQQPILETAASSVLLSPRVEQQQQTGLEELLFGTEGDSFTGMGMAAAVGGESSLVEMMGGAATQTTAVGGESSLVEMMGDAAAQMMTVGGEDSLVEMMGGAGAQMMTVVGGEGGSLAGFTDFDLDLSDGMVQWMMMETADSFEIPELL